MSIDAKSLRDRAERDARHGQPMGVDPSTVIALLDRNEQLERQMLAGLQALGISCNSIDQCASFEREVAGTVNVLEERMKRAEKQRDQVVNKVVRWCEDPQHRRNRTLNQQCELLDQLRSVLLDTSSEY